jgi:hypothetical protein
VVSQKEIAAYFTLCYFQRHRLQGVGMGTIFELNRRGTFNIDSARQLLPLVYKITAEIDDEFQRLMEQVNIAKSQSNVERTAEIEALVQTLIGRWEGKVMKLGLEPKGIWLVDFNAGDGFFCWKYPEMDIKFWHGYNDGFSGRKPIQDNHLNHETTI